jgi:hypothetical protein
MNFQLLSVWNWEGIVGLFGLLVSRQCKQASCFYFNNAGENLENKYERRVF